MTPVTGLATACAIVAVTIFIGLIFWTLFNVNDILLWKIKLTKLQVQAAQPIKIREATRGE